MTAPGTHDINARRLALPASAKRGIRITARALSDNYEFCQRAAALSTFPSSPLGRLINDVISAFGPQRVMWGSNFPVCGDAAAYRRDLDALARLVEPASSQVIEQITGSTAKSLWFGPKNDTVARAEAGGASDQP